MTGRWYIVNDEDGLELYDAEGAAETRARKWLESRQSDPSDAGWGAEEAE